MFIRELKNRSGSISVQIISKENGRYYVVKSIGHGHTLQEIERLKQIARQEMNTIACKSEIFASAADLSIESAFDCISNSEIQTVGPELIFGQIYDYLGFNKIKSPLFRHLVLARLSFPLSKLKTAEYIYRYQGYRISISSIYRFLDKLSNQLQPEVEQISFEHTKKVCGNLNVVFYDMTTIYFAASDEDDLRKTGFSKDGKHQKPQIFLGLLVSLGGYAIAYDIYEGNIYEGHTLIPFLERVRNKFDIGTPIVVADSGLLSKENIKLLTGSGYQYIIGARLKNESATIKKSIMNNTFVDGDILKINRQENLSLFVHYSAKRAAKDAHNRKKGLLKLEKQIKSGKLTKANINNRGYNKYLTIDGKVDISIDYDKFETDSVWDGLKGYLTNAELSGEDVLNNYRNLWYVERAFRMSKTDLRIRPIYHRLRNRIEAHICLSFVAYSLYKELERVLVLEKSELSVKQAAELTNNMYQIKYELPDSKQIKTKLLKMDEKQEKLYNIVKKYFLGVA